MLVRGSGTLLLSKPCPLYGSAQQHFLVTPSALTGEARCDFIHKQESLKADQVVEDGAGASGRGGRRTDSCRAAAAAMCLQSVTADNVFHALDDKMSM